MSTEKKLICDVCGEEWEEDFFCPKCSNQIYEEEVEVTRDELPDWDGDPRYADYPVIVTELRCSGDVCYNCCNCHERK